MEGTILVTFADDSAILAVGYPIEDSTEKFQKAIDKISTSTKNWKIKLNETKSTHVNFTNRNNYSPISIKINDVIIPHVNEAKYLGMTLDAKLKRKVHVGRKSNISIYNKKQKFKRFEIRYCETYLMLPGMFAIPIFTGT